VKRLSSALICILLAVPVIASAGEYSADQVLSFTRHLIAKKEYYRALVELRRLRSYYPEYITPLSFQVTEQYLLFRGKQFSTILGTRAGAAAGPLDIAADSLFKCDAAIAMANYGAFEKTLSRWTPGAEPFLDLCLKKRRLYAYLMERRYNEASQMFASGTMDEFAAYRDLVDRPRAGFSHEKKPWLSAVLGIIPGMGYVYSEEYGTGIFAFLLITVDVIMTYFAFRTHNDVIGYFTGTMGCFFYAGSIAGGYLAARRFNTRLSSAGGDSLSDRLMFGRDREKIMERHGIGKE
jgi:hypothetical protein